MELQPPGFAAPPGQELALEDALEALRQPPDGTQEQLQLRLRAIQAVGAAKTPHRCRCSLPAVSASR